MRYAKSKAALERAKRLIPLASQTFSKAYNRWPSEAPHFLSHGKGGRVWDVDGNEYVDLVCGLLPIVLGYADPDVDAAIKGQLEKGISFSLPTLLEGELADRLARHIPCCEMARFGKSGTDVTSAAVRLARAVTGRDHIIMCGYHGWQDWSIGQADTVENRAGVPEAVRRLTTAVNPNGLRIFGNERPHAVAAVIIDCSKVSALDLTVARQVADSCGGLLIFDEVITGFRWDIGGAQAVYGVTPDLACFSKAMGNGMPISAIVGRRDLMKEFDHVFFSGTFGGETLSIAAAIATIDKIERENVCEKLSRYGLDLWAQAKAMTEQHQLSKHVWLNGHDTCRQLNFSSKEVRETFLTSMLAHGVLVNTAHNICFAHDEADFSRIHEAWHHSLLAVDRCLHSEGLMEAV